ncbi:hypothetical protein SCHPADRAFT_898800 [Schizopora paradoxa]|uniref:Hydrophobin n=1 Tax=Schizopora paradoxa TaxID=27342 RepID=A0A0H2S5N2_9AGAM|nr:hypothetical protein SCHPADRAFT_898800 [Schizopora paradoxa]
MKFAIFTILAAASAAFAQNACCESTSSSSTPATSDLLGALGIILGANVPVGINCNPITVIGVSGTSCTAQPVNCSDILSQSLVGIGCTPIAASL